MSETPHPVEIGQSAHLPSGYVSPWAYVVILVVLLALAVGIFFFGYPLVIITALIGTGAMLLGLVLLTYSD